MKLQLICKFKEIRRIWAHGIVTKGKDARATAAAEASFGYDDLVAAEMAKH